MQLAPRRMHAWPARGMARHEGSAHADRMQPAHGGRGQHVWAAATLTCLAVASALSTLQGASP